MITSRLLTLTNQKTVGDVISSYAYQYNPAGMRTKVTLSSRHSERSEESHDYIDYAYDAVNRLTSEVKHKQSPSSKTYYSYNYDFDPVGNRTTLGKNLHKEPKEKIEKPKDKAKPGQGEVPNGNKEKEKKEKKEKPSFWDLTGLTDFSYTYDSENRLLQVSAVLVNLYLDHPSLPLDKPFKPRINTI